MTRKVFLILLALVLALSVGLVGCGGTGEQQEEEEEEGIHDLTITSTAGGEVTTPGEGTFNYTEGTAVNLVAEAEEGYSFVEWTGDVDTISDVEDANTTITINDDYSIVASFVLGVLIRDWYDLDAIRGNLEGVYILMNDLDATTPGYTELASSTANGGEGWDPLGGYELEEEQWVGDSFEGTFDGRGFEIRDLFINRPDEDFVGLFGHGQGSIGQVGVVSAVVTGHWCVGALLGFNGGTVSDSYSAGTVTGMRDENQLALASSVGGLVGQNWGAVSESYSACSVVGESSVGGLVGANTGAVTKCYSTGSIDSENDAGGLVGSNDGPLQGPIAGHGQISSSYSTASVTGESGVGGLVGSDTKGLVTDSYSTGTVTGESYVGGLMGGTGLNEYHWAGTVDKCYSIGKVTGSEWVGGLMGRNYGTVSDSFWDTQTTEQATSDGGEGDTSAGMQELATFSAADWNITAVAPGERNTAYVWNIVDGQTYPFLSWQA